MCATDEGVLKGEHWCKKCIWGNLLPQWKDAFGNVDQISSGDFVSLWTQRIDRLANKYSVAEGLTAISRPSKSLVHRQISVGRSKPHHAARRLRVAAAGDKVLVHHQ